MRSSHQTHLDPGCSTPIPFSDYCVSVEHYVKRVYEVTIIATRDIPKPFIGDLDGCEIEVAQALGWEERLFAIVHLFGHTVQWNVNPATFELGRLLRPPVHETMLPDILNYEREAARYGLALLHEVGIVSIDQWFSDYSACDEAYLFHFYGTGERRNFISFWRSKTPRVEPKAIPRFVPRKRGFRHNGLVI